MRRGGWHPWCAGPCLQSKGKELFFMDIYFFDPTATPCRLLTDPFQCKPILWIESDVTRANDAHALPRRAPGTSTMRVGTSTTSARRGPNSRPLRNRARSGGRPGTCAPIGPRRWRPGRSRRREDSPSSAASPCATCSCWGGDGDVDPRCTHGDLGPVRACKISPKIPQNESDQGAAGKLALVARTDHANLGGGRTRTDAPGRRFQEELGAKFAKWKEPDKAQTAKALPKPDLTTKKRSRGKHIRRLKERFEETENIRRLKERFEETEMMKQANRHAFSTEAGEYGGGAMGLTLGMLEAKPRE
ncbi:hypothetical protein ACHAWF_010000 [Thalassiosira exigua]